MIVRIVKLLIEEEKKEKFSKFFHDNRLSIEQFNGCLKVELLEETEGSNVFFTYSHWEDNKSLEKYRNSAFFKEVWKNTKLYFCGKPEAWSLKKQTND